MPEPTSEQTYDASDIQHLKGIEGIRTRPAMYIGDTGSPGLHHLVYEVVDNSIDEAVNGFASEIHVQINVDESISIVDNGRGIPVDVVKGDGRSTHRLVTGIADCDGAVLDGAMKFADRLFRHQPAKRAGGRLKGGNDRGACE